MQPRQGHSLTHGSQRAKRPRERGCSRCAAPGAAGSVLSAPAACQGVKSAQNARKDRSSTGLSRWLSNICCPSPQVPSRAFLLPFTAPADTQDGAEPRRHTCAQQLSYMQQQGAAEPPQNLHIPGTAGKTKP